MGRLFLVLFGTLDGFNNATISACQHSWGVEPDSQHVVYSYFKHSIQNGLRSFSISMRTESGSNAFPFLLNRLQTSVVL